jgi:AraC-like DNA-binding protein
VSGRSLITQMRFNQEGQPLHSHFHLASELVFVLEGAAEFTIGDRSYPAEAGSLVFISGYEEHQVQVLREPYRRYFLMVQAPELESALGDPVLTGVFRDRPAGFCHCVSLSEASPEPERLFARLLREWDSPAPYSAAMVNTLLEQVLILAYRACPGNFTPLDAGAAGRVRDIQRYIEANFRQDLRISDLASRFYMNHCYMTHLFKKQVGCSPKQYLLLTRLSYAKELLETTSLPVSEISSQSGFGDVNNFIRAFRENCSVPPTQYRREFHPSGDSPEGGALESRTFPVSPSVNRPLKGRSSEGGLEKAEHS